MTKRVLKCHVLLTCAEVIGKETYLGVQAILKWYDMMSFFCEKGQSMASTTASRITQPTVRERTFMLYKTQ